MVVSGDRRILDTQYLEKKLRLLKAAKVSRLILLIDEKRNVSKGELRPGMRVMTYQRKIDVNRLIEMIS